MYLTDELLPYCLHQSLSGSQDFDRYLDTVSQEERAAINHLLSEVLSQESAQDVEIITLPDVHAKSLDSIVSGGGSSDKSKVVAYNFKNAAKESLLPVLGLIAAATGLHVDLKQIPSATGMLVAWWRNLVVLRSPQDDDAIAVVRAIGVLRLRAKWEPAFVTPSNDDLAEHTGLPPHRLHLALQKLKQSGVIQVAAWGNQAEDYTHCDNRWSVSF